LMRDARVKRWDQEMMIEECSSSFQTTNRSIGLLMGTSTEQKNDGSKVLVPSQHI